VKHLLLYFLAFIVLATNTSVGELFKVPVLLNHFLEHRQRDHNIGLSQFMSMHYWGNDIKDNDTDRDMKLPFKKLTQTHHQLLYQKSIGIWQPLNNIITIRNIEIPQDPSFQNHDGTQLYRPPQFA